MTAKPCTPTQMTPYQKVRERATAVLRFLRATDNYGIIWYTTCWSLSELLLWYPVILENQVPIDDIYGHLISKWVAVTWFNILRLRQRHFADDLFESIFLNKTIWILIKISLKFVPKGPVNNVLDSIGSYNGLTPTRRQGIIWTNDDFFTTYLRHSASMS